MTNSGKAIKVLVGNLLGDRHQGLAAETEQDRCADAEHQKDRHSGAEQPEEHQQEEQGPHRVGSRWNWRHPDAGRRSRLTISNWP
ncbi:hypothetical protein [Bradyrhizobium sp. STM 3562]|uniref:hypothetical protein n=1 Tax=Bradyrhizobium sp. STM 3562 TaxID=578924 RepID=UPI0038909A03